MADNNFIIYINPRFYWQIDLQPVETEKDTYVNYVSLIDSESQKCLETLAYKSDYLIPVLKSKNNAEFKKIGENLRDISIKHGIQMIKGEEMPQDKRRKELKPIGKKRKI